MHTEELGRKKNRKKENEIKKQKRKKKLWEREKYPNKIFLKCE